jgi:hypothetical protein
LWDQLAAGRFAQPGSNDLFHARWMMLGCWAAGLLGCWHSTEIGSIMQSVMQWCSSAAMGKTLPADDASGLRVWNYNAVASPSHLPSSKASRPSFGFLARYKPGPIRVSTICNCKVAAAPNHGCSRPHPTLHNPTVLADSHHSCPDCGAPTAADSASTRAPSARAAGTVDNESRAGWRREDYQRRNRQHSIHS